MRVNNTNKMDNYLICCRDNVCEDEFLHGILLLFKLGLDESTLTDQVVESVFNTLKHLPKNNCKRFFSFGRLDYAQVVLLLAFSKQEVTVHTPLALHRAAQVFASLWQDFPSIPSKFFLAESNPKTVPCLTLELFPASLEELQSLVLNRCNSRLFFWTGDYEVGFKILAEYDDLLFCYQRLMEDPTHLPFPQRFLKTCVSFQQRLKVFSNNYTISSTDILEEDLSTTIGSQSSAIPTEVKIHRF